MHTIICSLVLLLLLLLSGCLILLLALNDDQVVVPIWSDHDIVPLASHSEECQVVFGVKITDERASSYGQLRKSDSVLDSLIVLSHSCANNLGLVSLFHLGLFDNNQTLDTFMG